MSLAFLQPSLFCNTLSELLTWRSSFPPWFSGFSVSTLFNSWVENQQHSSRGQKCQARNIKKTKAFFSRTWFFRPMASSASLSTMSNKLWIWRPDSPPAISTMGKALGHGIVGEREMDCCVGSIRIANGSIQICTATPAAAHIRYILLVRKRKMLILFRINLLIFFIQVEWYSDDSLRANGHCLCYNDRIWDENVLKCDGEQIHRIINPIAISSLLVCLLVIVICCVVGASKLARWFTLN